MTKIMQLEKWLNGESLHNDETNECCPDFSCCDKKITTEPEIKKLYYDAYISKNADVQYMLSIQFLGIMFRNATDKKIYIAGQKHIEA